MSSKRGFTLIETMVATGILVTSLMAVAAMFAYSIRTNYQTEQTTTGTLLVSTKLEDLRATALANLVAGGGLDAASPTPNYFEYVSISTSGVITTSAVNNAEPYLRMWQITGTTPRLITVSVYAQSGGVTGEATELARATTEVSNGL